MDKPCKRDTSLCERDALADQCAQEQRLLVLYAEFAGGGGRSLRTRVFELFSEAAEDAAMLAALAVREAEEEGPAEAHLRKKCAQWKKELKPCLQ